MKLYITILPPLLLLSIFASDVKSKTFATTGREFRKLHPELRRRGKLHGTPTYVRLSRSPVWTRHLPVYGASPRRRHFRRRFIPNPIIRRSLLHARSRRLTADAHLTSNTTKPRGKFGPVKMRLGSTTKREGNRLKYLRKEPQRSRAAGISHQRQYMINQCKSIKAGKCCKGWLKHPLTGYCMPSCSTSCDHGTCQNEHVCKCDDGYAGPLCNIDINECAKDVCEHGCVNTYGSYRCVCHEGYAVEDDGTCTRIDPCARKKCQYKCYTEGEVAKCVCPKGYRVDEDGKHCRDVDECAERDIKCHTEDQFRSCRNLPGSYICSCREGFFYHRYFKKCYDSNECLLEKHDCNVTVSRCVNTEGSYICQCRNDYVGDGATCWSMNGVKGLKCDVHARVVVSETGETKCQCMEGFIEDGRTCKSLSD